MLNKACRNFTRTRSTDAARRSPRRLLLLLAAAMAGVAGVSGCVGYSGRAAPDESPFTDPNAPSSYQVTSVALRWVVRRYPPEGDRFFGYENDLYKPAEPRLAFSLPEGTRKRVYEIVTRQTEYGAVPVTPENVGTLPVYYVSRVYVEGDFATVDILRPLPGLAAGASQGVAEGADTGSDAGAGGTAGASRLQSVYQGITVNLRGGIQPWRVTSHKVWTVGAMPLPPVWYLPEKDAYEEARPRTQPARSAEPVEAPGAEGEPAPEQPPASDGAATTNNGEIRVRETEPAGGGSGQNPGTSPGSP